MEEASTHLLAAGTVLAVIVGSLATATVLLTVDVETRPAPRRARRLLGTALFLWTLAEGYRAVTWALSGAAPGIPSLADLLRLAGYMSTLAAAVSYSAPPGGRYGRLHELLDTAILVIAGAALSWLVIIRPVSMALPSNTVLLGWASVAPVFDLILVLLGAAPAARVSLVGRGARLPRNGRGIPGIPLG